MLGVAFSSAHRFKVAMRVQNLEVETTHEPPSVGWVRSPGFSRPRPEPAKAGTPNQLATARFMGGLHGFPVAHRDHEPVRQTFLSASLVRGRGRQECLPHSDHRRRFMGSGLAKAELTRCQWLARRPAKFPEELLGPAVFPPRFSRQSAKNSLTTQRRFLGYARLFHE